MESKIRRTTMRSKIALFCALSLCTIILFCIYLICAKRRNAEREQRGAIKHTKIDFQIEEMADMKYVNLFCENNKLATVHLNGATPVGFEVMSSNNTIIAFSDIDNDKVIDVIIVFDSNYNVIEYYNIKKDTSGKKETINKINDISNKFNKLIEVIKVKQEH